MQVQVKVPQVPHDADVYASWRTVLTGIRETGTGRERAAGEEVEAGALIEAPAGALLLVVDRRLVRWETPYRGGRRYPVKDATVTLHLLGADGLSKPLWQRHFASEKSAFGAAGVKMLTRHLEAHSPAADMTVREIEPGPGRPNLRTGDCRWCRQPVQKQAGRLVGHGTDAEVEHHRGHCPAPRPVEPGQECTRCGTPTAPRTATMVQVREGEGRWEVQHTGLCERHPSLAQYQQRQEEIRQHREAQREREAERERKREAAAVKRRAKAAAERAAEKAAAVEAARRVDEHGITHVRTLETPYDKRLDSTGTRMRLVARELTLGDGSTVPAWDVETYGGHTHDEDGDERARRFYRLPDAHSEYQEHSYQEDPTPPARTTPPPPAAPAPAPARPEKPEGLWRLTRTHEGSRRRRPAAWAPRGTALRATIDPLDRPLPEDTPGLRQWPGHTRVSAIVTIEREDRPQYFADGEDEDIPGELLGTCGWYHVLWVRPATPAEAAPLLEEEARLAHRDQLTARVESAFAPSAADAVTPPAREIDPHAMKNAVEVDFGAKQRRITFDLTQPDRLCVDEQAGTAWYLQYNGREGDNWSVNNYGSFIARRYPLTEERRRLITDLRAQYGA